MEKNKVLKFLVEVSGKSKLNIAVLTVIQLALGICGVIYALLLKNIINAAVDGRKSDFFISLAEFSMLVIFQIILRAINRRLDELTKSTLENHFKSRLFSALLKRDFSAVNAMHSGDWLNRLTSDSALTANALTVVIPGISGMAVQLTGAVIMIMLLEPKFCFLILPCGILLIVFSVISRKKIKLLHRAVQEKDGALRTYFQDILGSMLVIRSYAAENEVLKTADAKMNEHRAERMKKNRFSNLCNIGFGTIMNGAYVLGAAFCGYGILTNAMSCGTFTAVLQLIGQIQSPFANISGYFLQWHAMTASAERLMYAEEFAEQSTKNAFSLNEITERYKSDFKAIGLENACFTYYPVKAAAETPITLKNISFEVKKGEYIALTGRSGCGKSTVIKLLLSLYRLESGEKYIICGNEKKTLDFQWQRIFAYVPQENYLMTGTVREIISLADSHRKNDDEAIKNALKAACADAFVSKLENGIDTPLGERGHGLSEGQMQRLAVARAVFSGSPVLLLDEATSSLDEQTERMLIENLRSFTDKTVIIVTHRPASLEICDRIIEFTENGLNERRKNDRIGK